MKTVMVIPTYWGRNTKTGWQMSDDIYDHPTPLNREGTLGRVLKSINILEDKDFELVIPVVSTAPEIRTKVYNKVKKIVDIYHPPVKTYLFADWQLKEIKKLYQAVGFNESLELLTLSGYSNIRNMCLFSAYLLQADVVVLIDDDEVFEDPKFMNKAKKFIGGRMFGQTVDGVAGYYLNRHDEYYDDVEIEPWMTFWNRFGSKAKAFDKVINRKPRLKATPFAFGGCMVIHRSLFKIVPFDPNLPRGEDIDYVINSRMFSFNFFLDNKLNIKHLPPPKHHPIWQRLRQDIFRFYYDRAKIEGQFEKPNMVMVEPADFDPYPGEFLTEKLEVEVFRTNVLLALDYLSRGMNKESEAAIKNIYLSKYETIPKNNVFAAYLKVQENWEMILSFARENLLYLKSILEKGIIKSKKVKRDFNLRNGMVFTPDNLSRISKLPFFISLNEEEVQKILQICNFEHYEPDSVIVSPGSKDQNIYIISEGKVKIVKEEDESGEKILLGKLKEGEHFGESSLFSSKSTRFLVEVVAELPTELIVIQREKLLSFFGENYRSSVKLLLYLSKKLNDRLEEVTERYTDSRAKNIDLSQKID